MAKTKGFAAGIIRFYCTLPKSRTEVQVLGKKLLGSDTSVAANCREASGSRSDAEFIAKIEQCAQETDESILWLKFLRDGCGIRSENIETLLNEADQLIAISVTMSKNVKNRIKAPK